MNRLLLLLLLIAFSAGVAQAGPNANGAIIVHTSATYNFSAGTICTTTLGQPATCADALTTSSRCGDGGGLPANVSTIWFMAAFLPTATPAVASVYFGTNVDEANVDAGTRFGYCGPANTVQDVSATWPYNGGASVGFGTPITGNTLFRFYYFGVENVDCDSAAPNPWWCSTINPVGGFAAFYDTSFPPIQDDITQFGCIKWYEAGSNQCPQELQTGACCALNGVCTVTAEMDCISPSIWHPEWTSCEPNNCPQPTAACCALNGSCTVTTQAECIAPSVWHAEWTSCEPNNCPQPPLPPPTLLTPADAATCVALPVTLDWTDVTGATGYKVQIGVACGAGLENLVTPSQYTPTLDPGTTYFWRVATKNVSGIWGEYSSCYTFTTAPTPLAAPALLTPANGATCQPASGTLTWSSVPSATGYRVQLGTTPGTGDEFDVASAEYAYSGLAAGVTYYWRVKTKDSCNNYGNYSNSSSFTTDNPLAAPTLLSPPAGASDQPLSVTLDWTDVADATGYIVQFGTTCGAGPETPVTASEYPVSGLTEGTTYFWRVKTKNSCDTYGAYSGCFQFTTLLPTAACCAPSGACTVTTQAACTAPSVWHPEWLTCTPNNCPQPQGACCVPDTGVCTYVTQAECMTPSVWHGDWTCSPNQCPVTPFGACCVPDTGVCTYVYERDCAAPSIWHGDWTCSPNQCPVTPFGACCAPSGACTYIYERDCMAPSIWHGDWTCSPNQCPLPPATAACCDPTGGCTVTTEAACIAPSVWHAEWTSCEPNNCPLPTAACCAPSGACTVTTEAACTAPSVWHPEWLTCTPNNCPQPQGACCVPDTGVCTYVTEAECMAPSVWHGDWTCSPNQCPVTPFGACCAPSGACTYIYERDCMAPSIWHGDWTCSPNQCPLPPATAACCDPMGGCTVTTEVACIAPSVWHAEWTSCEPNNCPLPPPTGACCAPSGACTVTTEAACMTPSVWHAEWLTCTPNNCPQPQGACCVPDTGVCTYVTQAECMAPSVWHGDWTCSPNNCPVTPFGACCVPDTGVCTYVYERDCMAPSVWHGDWTCSPNQCPVTPFGACCAPSGACTYTYERDCMAPSIWHGDWTCSPNQCPLPPATGACCDTATGACTITTEADCSFTWLGADVPCNLTTCPMPPSDCVMTMVFPNGGQVLRVGRSYTILWTPTDCGPTVQIDLLLNDVVCQPIAASTENDGSFAWVAAQCGVIPNGYKIRVTDLTSGHYAQSATPFSIAVAPTSVSILSPAGDVDWLSGETMHITWLSTNGGPTVKIELIRNGAPCVTIASAAPNTGSYDWIVEGCPGTLGAYKIRITDLAADVRDQSRGTFRISQDVCRVEVTSPSGHDVWPRGSQQEITWSGRGGCGSYVKIELLKKVGGTYEPCITIADNTLNDGSFAWTVDRCGSANSLYRIRVTDLLTGMQGVSGGSLKIPQADDRTATMASVSVPNPFRQNALVVFELSDDAEVHAGIYNVTGQMIRGLVDQVLPSGHYEIAWDARDYTGVAVPSGIYYLRAIINGEQITKKVLLIH